MDRMHSAMSLQALWFGRLRRHRLWCAGHGAPVHWKHPVARYGGDLLERTGGRLVVPLAMSVQFGVVRCLLGSRVFPELALNSESGSAEIGLTTDAGVSDRCRPAVVAQDRADCSVSGKTLESDDLRCGGSCAESATG